MKKTNKFIIKIVAILLSAVAVNFAVTGLNKTYSWFYSTQTDKINASAINPEGIVRVSIKDDKNNVYEVIPRPTNPVTILNPTEIIVTKGPDAVNPIIYYQVTGDISNYILHINPLDLMNSTSKTVSINTIDPNENKNVNGQGHVDGIITIKYLNGLIDEPVNVQFDYTYLKKRNTGNN